MAKILSCREAGYDCDYVARGETEEEIMQAAAKHAKQVHSWTDAQLNDPQAQQQIRGMIREERP